MTVTVSTTDKCSLKALKVLEGADLWQRGHLKDGNRPFFAIPSIKDASRLYMTDARDCTCPDRTRRQVDCCHMLAVRLWLAREQAPKPKQSPKPAAKPAPTYASVYGVDGEGVA